MLIKTDEMCLIRVTLASDLSLVLIRIIHTFDTMLFSLVDQYCKPIADRQTDITKITTPGS